MARNGQAVEVEDEAGQGPAQERSRHIPRQRTSHKANKQISQNSFTAQNLPTRLDHTTLGLIVHAPRPLARSPPL